MPSYRRLIALGLARALLAGPPTLEGLRARAATALDLSAARVDALAQSLSQHPPATWPWLPTQALAGRLLGEPEFEALLASHEEPPHLRRYILRPPVQRPPPLGLDEASWPAWPTVGDLAPALGLDSARLDWLTACPARRRKSALAWQHYRFLLLDKRGGGLRLIEAPKPVLKQVQRRLLDSLLARMPVHESAVGFRRGASVVDHARRHAGQAVLLRFDLRDFFGHVHAGRVHALFETIGYPEAVARTLTALCTCRTPEPVLQRLQEERGLDRRHLQRLRDPHLPQGAPTSPALANLAAFRLDLRLQGLADSLQARYSRYADDIVFSGPALLQRRAPEIEAFVAALAIEEGFALQHRKTHVATQAAQQRACGIVVNRHPNLPRAEFDRLKATLHRRTQQGPVSPDEAFELRGRVAWARQLNPAKAQRLQRLLDRLVLAEGPQAERR
jgi:hypothetical protein